MKRLVGMLTLILCLSFPALAGHTQLGGRYCPCDNPETCTNSLSVRTGDSTAQENDATENTTELAIVLLLLTAWLKLKA